MASASRHALQAVSRRSVAQMRAASSPNRCGWNISEPVARERFDPFAEHRRPRCRTGRAARGTRRGSRKPTHRATEIAIRARWPAQLRRTRGHFTGIVELQVNGSRMGEREGTGKGMVRAARPTSTSVADLSQGQRAFSQKSASVRALNIQRADATIVAAIFQAAVGRRSCTVARCPAVTRVRCASSEVSTGVERGPVRMVCLQQGRRIARSARQLVQLDGQQRERDRARHWRR